MYAQSFSTFALTFGCAAIFTGKAKGSKVFGHVILDLVLSQTAAEKDIENIEPLPERPVMPSHARCPESIGVRQPSRQCTHERRSDMRSEACELTLSDCLGSSKCNAKP